MLLTHMVKAFFDAIVLFVTEEAASYWLEGCFSWDSNLLVLRHQLLWLRIKVAEDVNIWVHTLIFWHTNEDSAVFCWTWDFFGGGVLAFFFLFLKVVFFEFLMLFTFFMLVHLLYTFENFVAGLAFVWDLSHGTCIGRFRLSPLLIKDFLRDGSKVSHASFCVVDMIVSGQMEFVIDHRVEFNMACGANDLFLLLNDWYLFGH